MEQILLEKDFIKDLETQEAQYWSEYYLCCSNPLIDKLGVRVNVIDGTMCCAISTLDILAFNRVIGIGLESPVNRVQLDDIIKFYKKAGTKRFFVQVSPAAEPGNYNKLLIESGFNHYNNWVKFYKKIDRKIIEPKGNITVENLRLEETEIFDQIINDSFEFTDQSKILFTQTFKRPGWKHYLAKENGNQVAAASLFICGKYASLAIAGTIPGARGKGVHSSLIARRINDAHEAGCEYIIVETAEDKPDKPSASNRNMKRFGFEPAYLRPNYIYQF